MLLDTFDAKQLPFYNWNIEEKKAIKYCKEYNEER